MAGIVGADEDDGDLGIHSLDVSVLKTPDEVFSAVAGESPVEGAHWGEVFIPRLLTGQDRGAGGAADGVSAKGIFEEPAFIGDAVDIRCRCNFPEALTVGGNRFGGVVIGKDENNVRVSCRLSDSNGREDGNEDSQEIFDELLKPSPNALAGQEKNLRYGYVS